MLVLSRRESERILVGGSIVVTVVRVSGDKVRLGIEAPENVVVLRGELEPHLPGTSPAGSNPAGSSLASGSPASSNPASGSLASGSLASGSPASCSPASGARTSGG